MRKNINGFRIKVWLVVLGLIGLSLACGNFIPVTGDMTGNMVTLSGCYQISFVGNSRNQDGLSNWHYQVEELPCAQDLNYVLLEIPACAVIEEVSPSSWEAVQVDPDTQANGIMWHTSAEFQGGEFIVTLSGGLMRGTVRVGAVGSDLAMGSIHGPICDPTIPTSTISLTPGTPSPTATVRATITSTRAGTSTETLSPDVTVPTTQPRRTRTPVSTQAPTASLTPTSTVEPTLLPASETAPAAPDSGTPATSTVESLFTVEAAAIPTVIHITESDEILTYSCHGGDAVEVHGNINVVTLLGSCSSITITGNHNRVYWEAGSPVVEDTGNGNSVSQNGAEE